jgi:hypothetical protein
MDIFAGVDTVFETENQVEMTNFRSLFKPQIHDKLRTFPELQECSPPQSDPINILHL